MSGGVTMPEEEERALLLPYLGGMMKIWMTGSQSQQGQRYDGLRVGCLIDALADHKN